jgi:hypothetical protein
MATISIAIPDELLPRVINGMCGSYFGRRTNHEEATHNHRFGPCAWKGIRYGSGKMHSL